MDGREAGKKKREGNLERERKEGRERQVEHSKTTFINCKSGSLQR
jgi:hypothetical protein